MQAGSEEGQRCEGGRREMQEGVRREEEDDEAEERTKMRRD